MLSRYPGTHTVKAKTVDDDLHTALKIALRENSERKTTSTVQTLYNVGAVLGIHQSVTWQVLQEMLFAREVLIRVPLAIATVNDVVIPVDLRQRVTDLLGIETQLSRSPDYTISLGQGSDSYWILAAEPSPSREMSASTYRFHKFMRSPIVDFDPEDEADFPYHALLPGESLVLGCRFDREGLLSSSRAMVLHVAHIERLERKREEALR